ncbi:hypothetical protein NDN08_007401 [Rhodosorus marinus]|uniref:Peptidase M16 N-terminal domain-containing protein n=1 Tax=Rhodosorus marinus TaxID=101924 RepID=A0AAV8V3A7_9RHOD|nr:hypothetical protein NDN08_007401 [Rhodosorus marinus]
MLTGFVVSAGCIRRFVRRSSRRSATIVDSMPLADARGVGPGAESARRAPLSSVPSSTVSYFESGAKVVLFRAPGPICSATVAVATTPVSDGGHPHCLEHLIFMGSQKYPRRGFLDMLATRSYSDGTNAWTCEDHTAYTISTAGAEGLLRVLPVYLDHILNPKFDEEQFQQEVYHVRRDGEEAGVVFQEMRGRENTEGDILSSAWHRALFRGSFLSYDCGGRTESIAQLTKDEVERFHTANYRRSNMTVILVGGDDLDLQAFISAMKPALEEEMTGSHPEISLDQRCLPVEKILLSETLEQRKLFPAADEDVGSLTIAWHGPKLADVRNTLAVEMILRFLTENEASLLNRRFTEVVNPFCSSIDYSIELFPTTVFILGFGGIPNDEGGESLAEEGDEEHEEDGSDQMDLEEEEEEHEEFVQDRGLLEPGIMSELVMQELSSVVNNGFPGGVEAIKETILRYRRNLLLELENNVHSHVVDALIPDAIHEDGLEIGTRLQQEFKALDTLLAEGEEFWKGVVSQWLVKNRSRASFVGKPSRDLSTQLQRQREESAAARHSSMNGAKAEDPKPSSIDLTSVTFPSLPDAARIAKLPCTVNRIDYHSQTIQVDSAFSGISIVVDTKHISKELREHLPLFCSLLFSVDVLRGDGSVEGYESFVRRLNEATIHCYAGVGRNAGTFRAGAIPSCVVVDVSTESGREAQAMEMVLQSVFRSSLSCERVSAMLSNLNSDATESIREGEVVCRAFSRLLHERAIGSSDSNAAMLTVIQQHEVLQRLQRMKPTDVIEKLEQLRTELFKASTPFIHVGSREPKPIIEMTRSLWSEAAGRVPDTENTTHYRHQRPKKYQEVKTASKVDTNVIVPIAGVQSGYFRLQVDCPVHHDHPDYYALEVLCEMWSRTEGPLYNGIRGEGLAYGASLWLSPIHEQLVVSISESSSPNEAWDVFVTLLTKSLENDMAETSSLEMDAAKAAVLYQMHGDRMTPSMASDLAFAGAARGVIAGNEEFARREKLLHDVTIEDLKRVERAHLERLLEPENGIAVVTCGLGSSDSIRSGFKSSKCPILLREETVDMLMSD